MDAKTRYSKTVKQQKANAIEDKELMDDIKRGHKRLEEYGNEWDSVNLNDVMEYYGQYDAKEIDGNKIKYYYRDKKIIIILDIGGGYLRVQDVSKEYKNPHYLDIHGNESTNYKDVNGKIRGKTKKQFNRDTHYRIKKVEEM